MAHSRLVAQAAPVARVPPEPVEDQAVLEELSRAAVIRVVFLVGVVVMVAPDFQTQDNEEQIVLEAIRVGRAPMLLLAVVRQEE